MLLIEVEQLLPELLTDSDAWTGVYIDYHKPYVERLWIQWNEYRISLHKIFPCEAGESLFHPHPWPQAAKVVKGEYEMGIGYGLDDENPPPVAATIIVNEGCSYEMTDPNGWHYVQPLDEPSFSIMLTGKPWKKDQAKSKIILKPLTTEKKEKLLNEFRFLYGLNL